MLSSSGAGGVVIAHRRLPGESYMAASAYGRAPMRPLR